MRNTTLGLIAMLAIAGAPAAVAAQMPGGFSVDVRGGVGVPTGDLGDDEEGGAETGVGFGATAQFNVLPAVAVYGGWSRFSFPVESELFDEVENSADYIDSGYNAGVKLMLPRFMFSGLSPYLQGGAVYRELDLDFEDDELDVEGSLTDSALGFEIGGGLAFPLGQVISVTPGVRYVSYTPDEDDGAGDSSAISYVAADIGLSIRF